MNKNFRTLDLAVEFYKGCRRLRLPAHLRDQLHRAASSVPCNLMEGRAKPTLDDQKRFFYIALGSLRECEVILKLADLEGSDIWSQMDKLGAHLYNLIKNAG